MAGASLLTLLDDIATVLDDVAVLTKAAAKKTAGVLGDDLALNAQQVSGVRAERELPVVWAVFKGSLRNKLILVPAAVAISALLPQAVTPLLMLGGLFLCYEGFEKIAHKMTKPGASELGADSAELVADPKGQMQIPTADALKQQVMALEKEKIKGAVTTDFILSAEIIAITLGIVTSESIAIQFAILSIVALVMTLGVYGLVAGIVKLDDAGLYLSQRTHPGVRRLGLWIVEAAPYLMKTLSVVGTAAMFMVGGGILIHGIASLQGQLDTWVQQLSVWPSAGGFLAALAPTVLQGFGGVIAGALAWLVVSLGGRGWRLIRPVKG